MAQTLSAPGPGPGRISQILPSVKCSTCGKPVPIAELGDHVCAAPPPIPAASAKPPMSPTSPSFFQQKYQNLISANRPGTPKASPTPPPAVNAPPRLSSTSPAPRTTSPLSLQRGSLSSSSTSSRTPSPGPRVQSPLVPPSTAPLNVPRADRVSSQYNRAKTPESSNKIAFPSTAPGPPEPSPRVPSPLRHHPSEPTRVSTTLSVSSRTSSEPAPFLSHDSMRAPAVARTPSPGVASFSRQQQLQAQLGLNVQQQQLQDQPLVGSVQPLARPRAPSTASTRSATVGVRQPIQSSPAPFLPSPGPSSTLGGPSQFQQRPRAATDIGNGMPMSPPMGDGSDVIYSTPHRPMPPPGSPMRGPPLHLNPQYVPPGTPQPLSPHGPSSPAAENIDTKIGGEAGMAGVGRRGFAAAARAAMFTHHIGGGGPQGGHLSINSEYPGMEGRRTNVPHFLDISSASHYSANTPPLSPGSTASPRSPYSQQSPVSFAGPTSPLRENPQTVVTPTHAAILTRTPSPLEGGGMLRDRVIPPASEPPKVPLPATPSTPSMPFFEKFKNKVPPIDVPPRSPSPPATEKSPSSPAESEFEGLAYADSGDEENEDERARTTSQPTPPSRTRFLSMSSETSSVSRSDSKYSSGSTVQPLRLRSLSASTTSSTYTSKRATIRLPPGGLDLAMETLLEEESAPAATTTAISSTSGPAVLPLPPLPPLPTISAGGIGDVGSSSENALASQRDSVSRPKLPARANTTPGSSSSRPESRGVGAAVNGTKRRATEKVRKVKACLKCQTTIEDGKWIQMEGAGVMCDRCWKNMYLPKCRRCNLVIEKQAVSSSDGQLKGKYHRDCFNCHTCQKPFPEKEFYVFDGKPFCKYHYHEENNSLCAATLCGQPIEGPCAVAHNGDRYHPEHLTCEHPRCSEKLVDYWEVDGRMYCDKHAQGIMDEDEDDNYPMGNQRDSMLHATKRRTRFIDLAGFGQTS